MIRAQRETFAGLVQILEMVIGEVGMQIRATCILDDGGKGDGGGALIYSHVLAIVSPGFDCPCCLENYRARWIPLWHLQAEVRALRFRNIVGPAGCAMCDCFPQLPSYIRVNYKRRVYTQLIWRACCSDAMIAELLFVISCVVIYEQKRSILRQYCDDKIFCDNLEL